MEPAGRVRIYMSMSRRNKNASFFFPWDVIEYLTWTYMLFRLREKRSGWMGERRHSALFSCQKNEKEISIALLVRCTIIRNCTIANLFCRISYNAVDAIYFCFRAEIFAIWIFIFRIFASQKVRFLSTDLLDLYIYIYVYSIVCSCLHSFVCI